MGDITLPDRHNFMENREGGGMGRGMGEACVAAERHHGWGGYIV
jgi:hypothetical protein